jgi:hypothetical protein
VSLGSVIGDVGKGKFRNRVPRRWIEDVGNHGDMLTALWPRRHIVVAAGHSSARLTG